MKTAALLKWGLSLIFDRFKTVLGLIFCFFKRFLHFLATVGILGFLFLFLINSLHNFIEWFNLSRYTIGN